MHRSLDYDLLILGPSAGGLEAALLALQARSRVALLTLRLPLSPETIAQLNTLNTAGLDVIDGSGYFLPKDRGFQTPERSNPLRFRTALLALPAVPVIPNLPGLDTIPYQTAIPPNTNRELTPVPQHWIILGKGLDSLGDCYALKGQGHHVTLLLQNPLHSSLPQRLQRDLESQGVQIFTPIHGLTLSPHNTGIRVTASQGQWIGDRLLLSFGQQPTAIALQLHALHPQITLPLQVKPSLQSPLSPRLYGCGIALGGVALDSIARYEARIAVPNALYCNHRTGRYDCIPYRRLSTPLITQMGWSLEAAKHHWEQQGQGSGEGSVLRLIELTGFWDPIACPMQPDPLLAPSLQVLFHRNGQILGAQGIGIRSAQAIEVIALARQKRIPWSTLLRSLPGGEVADLLHGVESRLREHDPRSPGWETFFSWRRTGYL